MIGVFDSGVGGLTAVRAFDRIMPECDIIYFGDTARVPYGTKSKAANSLIADGCIIKGTVENSILFRGVYVAEGAVVKNSVVMQDSYLSEGAKINCAVLDKNVVIKPNKELSGAATCPLFIGKDITV